MWYFWCSWLLGPSLFVYMGVMFVHSLKCNLQKTDWSLLRLTFSWKKKKTGEKGTKSMKHRNPEGCKASDNCTNAGGKCRKSCKGKPLEGDCPGNCKCCKSKGESCLEASAIQELVLRFTWFNWLTYCVYPKGHRHMCMQIHPYLWLGRLVLNVKYVSAILRREGTA